MAKSGIDARRKAALEEGSAGYLARRAEIISVAADVFRKHGFESATLLDVANALGTDRASLYYYVGSKEELLQEIVRHALKNVGDVAERIKRGRKSTPDKIRALIDSMVGNYVENYPHMSIYTEDLGRISRQDSEWAVDVIDQTRRYEKVVRSIIAKGQRDGTLRTDVPLDLAVLSLFGMINWMHRWYRPELKYDADELSATFARVFLEGNATR
ncbi:TetR/AcrR family transcriptional regulator [Amycolatopsis sp. GM8]|uniref:TetR/AcrR family transcriptional regulator n=1 Tax=Amycolatopsis sp. GM8 TaxID=2896530 RepID=UPI001F3B5411|nr:TetR/AcrR family transcriptional regulator [Amycolatopsis sp. GM8]